MAVLYITEVEKLGQTLVDGQIIACPKMPPVAEQSIAIINGVSTPSAAFNPKTRFVMLNCDTVCSLAWSSTGTPPPAVTTAQRMGANETRFCAVDPGGTLAVTGNT